ncbi:MAG: hypothetical protein JW787_08695 [Sedimentisphaerales bacterium]|nr:hypothetical protein [Sedimentisphaerales bacterium]
MNHTHHFHDYQRNPLDIQQLAEFDEAISRYSQSEQRRRRLIYLRDAAQQLKTGQSLLKGFGWIMIPLAIIPIFWPFFIFIWFIRKKTGSMTNAQLYNALEYWGVHDVEIDAYVSGTDSVD